MSSNTLESYLQTYEQTALISTIQSNYPNSNLSVLKYYLKKNKWSLSTISFIRSLALIDIDIPEWNNDKLELTQLHAAYLLARSFLCMNKNQYDCIVIFDKLSDPVKPTNIDPIEYYKQLMLSNPLDPDEMFDLSMEKLDFLFNYFVSIRDQPLNGSIVITKIDNKFDLTNKCLLSINLTSIEFISGYMNHSDPIKVDFANKNIGGGVLKHGCCQEEIMFLTNPELIGIMSLVNTLDITQAVIVDGITQYSNAINYGFDLRYDNKNYSFDSKYLFNTKQTIIMIDAIDYRKRVSDQYLESNKKNEIQKAINGFQNLNKQTMVIIDEVESLYLDSNKAITKVQFINNRLLISTGHWGCGAFKGNKKLKFMIQWLAASITGNDLKYYIGSDSNDNELTRFYNANCQKTALELYDVILETI